MLDGGLQIPFAPICSGPLHRQLADCGFSPALQLRGLVFGLMVVGAVQIPFTMLIVFGHRQFAVCGFSPALQLRGSDAHIGPPSE